MILLKEYSNGNKHIFGKVSPSNLRWYGVEEELITNYNAIDAKLQVLCESYKEEDNAERARLFAEKKKAQEAIEQQLEELSEEKR